MGFDRFLECAMESGLLLDGVIGANARQYAEIWDLRENLASSLSFKRHLYAHDVSLPMAEFDTFVTKVREDVKLECDRYGLDDVVVSGFGHLGDGNLHINVSTPVHTEQIQDITE